DLLRQRARACQRQCTIESCPNARQWGAHVVSDGIACALDVSEKALDLIQHAVDYIGQLIQLVGAALEGELSPKWSRHNPAASALHGFDTPYRGAAQQCAAQKGDIDHRNE